MSLPLLHAGKSAPGLSAALDLRFALDKSLTAYRGPTPSFSRASTGTYFNSSGVLTSAAINGARFDHTYNGTSWVSKGLLVEEQRTNILSNSEDFNSWSLQGTTVTVNSTAAPDGATTADTVYETSTTGEHNRNQLVTSATGTYTASFFVKYINRQWAAIYIYHPSLTRGHRAWFDIQNGTVGTTAAIGTGLTNVATGITNCGNGWYRIWLTATTAATDLYSYFGCAETNGGSSSYAGNSANGYYVWGAQTELGAFPTSYIGTTSSAVVRSADVCQITGSDFSGFWNGTEGTIVGDFDRLFIPTGTASALYTARDSANNNAIYYYIDVSNDVSQVYASGASATFDFGAPVGAGISNKIATAYKANDFAASRNGSTPLTDTSGAVPSGQTLLEIGRAVSANYLNGHIARLRYYRKRLPNATLQLLSEPDPTLNLQFALNKTLTPVAGPAPSFSRASTGTFFNASGVLTSASINTPRFDHVYSGGQWVSKGLLLEEQRTNLIRNSEDFANASWLKFDSTVSSNFAESPDGTTTADKNIPNTNNAAHGLYNLSAISISSGTQYTASLFAKASGYNFIFVTNNVNISSTSAGVCVNLTDGSLSNSGASGTYSVTNVGNGWWRISCTATATTTNGYIEIYPRSTAGANASFAGNGTDGVLIWGCQLEAGAFPTSYIGTTSSAVVRSADVCQITGTSFNWMWNQGEGSVASEFDFLAAPADRVSPRVWYASDGAYTNGMWVQSGASDGFYVYQSGSSQAGLTATALGAGVSTKVSSAYKLNDFAASFNGASALTDTTGNVPTVNRMEIGFMSDISGRIINGHIAKLIYYPARLTNTKLQQLST